MAELAVLLLLAVAASATVPAHARDPPTQIKLIRGADAGGVVGDSMECVYTVFIRTGSIWKAGTDANITLQLAAADGNGVGISDLPSWGGLMGQGHAYFERGNLDIFSGRGPCMAKPPCWMRLTSDGTGAHHGWYCNYVEVTVTGPHKGVRAAALHRRAVARHRRRALPARGRPRPLQRRRRRGVAAA
ncbi:unnamed protein product [Miscanthus lutarioriparius]|uniref:PLAT domain-containing protein n=1 Tax=Miscanthus lutarioriparius TaxID=422564 RepID=A0A811Q262_9POAL|nr:unnamed protein product [Miscanthus lutarioriparius]